MVCLLMPVQVYNKSEIWFLPCVDMVRYQGYTYTGTLLVWYDTASMDWYHAALQSMLVAFN